MGPSHVIERHNDAAAPTFEYHGRCVAPAWRHGRRPFRKTISMLRILLLALALLLFGISAMALFGWTAAPGSTAGVYALCFGTLTFLGGWGLVRMRR